jgi:DNA adenine methylase
MKLLSPLRYPGGKAGLTPFLTDVLDLNDLRGVDYFEPYAGGAGAALGLLGDNVVNTISINDSDIRIYAFWKTVLNEPQWFADKILTAQLDLAEWRECRETCDSPRNKPLREIGFSSFYMNRCNRSGVKMLAQSADTSNRASGALTYVSLDLLWLSALFKSLVFESASL